MWTASVLGRDWRSTEHWCELSSSCKKAVFLSLNVHAYIVIIHCNTLYTYSLFPTFAKWACKTVAFLLHYFFLAAFFWTLCEAVMMYNLLVKVFHTNERKWAWFYLILGWGMLQCINIAWTLEDCMVYITYKRLWDCSVTLSAVPPLPIVVITIAYAIPHEQYTITSKENVTPA